MSTLEDGSESVDQFLARIASIKGTTDEEEERRKKRNEEELLKARKERQARRAERARSLSPSKTGPLPSLPSALNPAPSPEKAIDPPVSFSPRSSTLSRSNAIKISPTLQPSDATTRPLPDQPSPISTDPTPKSTPGLSRSGTLSWQQRPTSRDGPSVRSRPLSGAASVSPKPKEIASQEEGEPSRKDIASALASKDPSWFRQTQDRGASSAAYRKTQVEDAPTSLDISSRHLPGMSGQVSRHSRSATPEPLGQTQLNQFHTRDIPEPDRFQRGGTPDMLALRNSMASPSASRNIPSNVPMSDGLASSKDVAPHSPTKTSNILANRPISPTKGLGGFVESAMMRRSDSVSKRWSVQAGTGLKRGDSTVSARTTTTPTPGHSRADSKDTSTQANAPSPSPLAPSRPKSKPDPIETPHATVDLFRTSKADKPSDLALHMPESQSNSATRESDRQLATPPEDELLPKSPSKTMDQRRWSPTKSTWLESALQSKSEPVKLQPMKEDTPKWKVDLQRSKSRAGRDPSPPKAVEGSAAESESTKSPEPQPNMSLKSTKPEVVPKPTVLAVDLQNVAGNKSQVIPENRSSKPEIAPLAPKNAKITQDVASPETEKVTSSIQVSTPAKSVKPPPPVKAKPQTPPRTDFRASLKSRDTGPAKDRNTEPEFKAMFGKLKPTTTQNYVAPDELKTNILTGKAALNVTDGPQKTKRVDEFKESILAKKEEMKAAPIVPPKKMTEKNNADDPIPEALARRKTLSKAGGPPPKLQASPKPAIFSPKSVVTSSNVPERALTSPDTRQTALDQPEDAPASITKTKVATVKPETLPMKAPSTQLPSLTKSQSLPTPSSAAKEKPPATNFSPNVDVAPARNALSARRDVEESVLPVNSKLASRLNPNLAALISRGSSPRLPESPTQSDGNIGTSTQLASVQSQGDSSSSQGLNHMTKARAKGPKRRAPKAEDSAVRTTPRQSASVSDSKWSNVAQSDAEEASSAARTPAATQKPQASISAVSKQPLQPLKQAKVLPLSQRTPTTQFVGADSKTALQEEGVSTKPTVAAKSSELRHISGSQNISVEQSPSAAASIRQKPAVSASPKPVVSPKATDLQPQLGLQTPPKSDHLKQARIASGTPKRSLDDKDAPTPASKASKGLGVSMKPETPPKKFVVKDLDLTPPAENQIAQKLSREPTAVSSTLMKYFGSLPATQENPEFDAQAVLMSSSKPFAKSTTLQHTIFELGGDGKKSPLPAQQEHILYEESMYLVTHSLQNDTGSKTAEVYLWCGDQVSEAALEDVQIFCRKDAREHNTKLEVIKQGKEPHNFFQALGGIVIVRRSKSSAMYMLRGRRHLGHIAFDEVDLTASDLCPGFVYLISARFGKLYLWKGKGASPDEVGCARLVGMDLGLTGEIEEVEEGAETAAFWDSFSNQDRSNWSPDWGNRAKHNGYPCSLFRVEHERPKVGGFWGLGRSASPDKGRTKVSIHEISPFSQRDIQEPYVHILDAYRSMYVLVNKACAEKESEFISSIQLAQELAMLSPSIQDRSLLPSSFVVFGEPGPDIKTCFRKWTPPQQADADALCVGAEEVTEILKL